MIFCIDIGNSNIVMACYNDCTPVFQSRISTNRSLTADEYAVLLHGVLQLHDITERDIDGAAISSVVPSLTETMRAAIKKVTDVDAMIVGPDSKTGLEILIDSPKELGGDLVATAVAAKNRYPLPCVVIDMGTATTFTVLGRNGAMLGGAITPGLRVAVESLVSRTSMLVGIAFDAPEKVISTNTIDCLKSGAVYGTAASIDGMCSRIEKELGEKPTIVATGGLASTIIPHCEASILLDENLLMDGILQIYQTNHC